MVIHSPEMGKGHLSLPFTGSLLYCPSSIWVPLSSPPDCTAHLDQVEEGVRTFHCSLTLACNGEPWIWSLGGSSGFPWTLEYH